MKIRSLKTMALWLAVATMASSAPIFADDSLSDLISEFEFPARFENVKKADEISGAFVGIFQKIVTAQAFTAFAGGNPELSTEIQELISTLGGEGLGTLGGIRTRVADLLDKIGVHPAKRANLLDKFVDYFQAGIEYATGVATGASVPTQNTLFQQWQSVGVQLGQVVSSLVDFNNDQKERINRQFGQLTINLAQGTLAANKVLTTVSADAQFLQSQKDFYEALQNLHKIQNIFFRRLAA